MNKASIATNKTDEDAAIQAMDPAVYRLDIGADADISTLLDVIDKKSSVIEEQKQRIAILEEYLRLERARRFGPTSEKYAGQAELLFDEAEAIEQESSATAALEELQEQHGIQKKRGRKGLSKQLLRHQVHINLSDEEKAGAIDTFYTVAKEELDIVPAKARVIEYLQEKAVFIEGNSR